jgi:hypothetical protein
MGLGSTFAGLPSCGGEIPGVDPSPADAASDLTSTGQDAARSDTIIVPPIITTHLDVDFDMGGWCHRAVVSREQNPATTVCPGEDAGDASYTRGRVRACLPAPPVGHSCDDIYTQSCILNTYSCGLQQRATSLLCGPLPGPNDQCCYVTAGGCPIGRPFLVAGVARLASAGDDPSWAAALRPDVDALDTATRAALADVWMKDALAEHASVASFSRFVLQCLSLGAPLSILQGAQQACADEIEHARIAFGLASAYADRPMGPGRLDVGGALDENLDAVGVACGVAREGCIAELVSASIIARARDRARDPVVKRVLDQVAEQELAHALLAWRYLAWACGTGDARLRAQVARVFDHMHEHVGLGALTALPADADRMRAHGYLGADERRRIAMTILENVIRPAARALASAPKGGESARRVARAALSHSS